MKPRRFWIRFLARYEDGLLDSWPEHMQCWRSGYDPDDVPIHCAIVDAEDSPAAEAIVDSCFSTWRLDSITEQPLDWTPGSRFPNALPWGGLPALYGTPCRECGAEPGSPCSTAEGRRELTHQARWDDMRRAARAAGEQDSPDEPGLGEAELEEGRPS